MEILVLIKRVPDPNLPEQFISVSDSRNEIELHSAAQYSLNQYDLNAVEAAIAIKEANSATVTVITADDASADQYLRRALGMGADRAIRVEFPSKNRRDPFETAALLTEAIRQKGNPSLLIAGRAASDTDAGYVPYLVAQGIGVSALSPIVAIKSVSESAVVVGKLSDDSIDEYELTLPAMLLVSNEINKPRTPSLKGVMTAKKAVIEVAAVTPEKTAVATPPKYNPKSGQKADQSTKFIDGSDEDKAAALLAVLGK
jgi:electron transfer flavoprotein beta subunit